MHPKKIGNMSGCLSIMALQLHAAHFYIESTASSGGFLKK